jgi:hypothetical protein
MVPVQSEAGECCFRRFINGIVWVALISIEALSHLSLNQPNTILLPLRDEVLEHLNSGTEMRLFDPFSHLLELDFPVSLFLWHVLLYE